MSPKLQDLAMGAYDRMISDKATPADIDAYVAWMVSVYVNTGYRLDYDKRAEFVELCRQGRGSEWLNAKA